MNNFEYEPLENVKVPREIIGYKKGRICERIKYENNLQMKHFFLFNNCDAIYFLTMDGFWIKLK